MTAPLSAAIYVRVSTDEQARHGVSLAMQERHCREECARIGATVAAVYRDEGISGTTLDRPALQELLAALSTYDCVVVWKLDRLSRSVRGWSEILSQLQTAGVGFISVTERIDAGSAMGRAMLGVMSVFAELFVDLLRENVRTALQHVARDGRKPGGVVYGYVSADRTMTPDPEAAPVVREIFRRFLSGEPQRAIARDLTEREVPQAKDGATWTATHVGKILRNPIYIGQFRWGGDVWDGEHEPIVSTRAWNAAQKLLTQRGPTGGRPMAHWASFLTCGVCGGSIDGHCLVRNRWRYYTYMCRDRSQRNTRHESVSHPAEKLHSVVWRHTELLLADVDPGAAIDDVKARQARDSDRAGELLGRLTEIARQLDALAELYLTGVLDLETIERRAAPLREEQQRIDTALLQATPIDADLWRRIERMGVGGLLRQVREGSVEGQVAFLRTLYAEIALHPEGMIVLQAHGQEPIARVLPKYYAPRRGLTDVGF